MPDYKAPIRDIQFTLYDVLSAEQHYQRIGATEASRDLVDAILTEGGKFAEEVLAPLNQVGDRQGCKFENGQVTTPTGFQGSLRTIRGWRLAFPGRGSGSWGSGAAGIDVGSNQ